MTLRLEEDTELEKRTKMTVQEIVKLMSFCLNATFFTFRGVIYKQRYGTAMGSSVSVIAAELVMEDVEQRALNSFHCPIPYWKRYVDDTFTAVRRDLVEEFHQHLNGVQERIEFTKEIEENNKIAFLDVEIQRESDGKFTTRVYRKPTHTGQYLHYDSYAPMEHKRSVGVTLFKRALTHSTTIEDKELEEQRIERELEQNGYPRLGIAKMKKQANNKEEKEKTKWRYPRATIPYVKGQSETIRRKLANEGLPISFKPYRTIGQMVQTPKDQIEMAEQRGVVYWIPSYGSKNQSYVGETGRQLKTRVKEHMDDVRLGRKEKSAVSRFVYSEGIGMDWKNVRILDKDFNWKGRKIKESWMIMEKNPEINENKGCLDPSYLPLVRLYKERQERVYRCSQRRCEDDSARRPKEDVMATQQKDQKMMTEK